MYINYKGKKLWVNLDSYDYSIDYGVLQTEIQKVADNDAEAGYYDFVVGAGQNYIQIMFSWDKTPQGDEFWRDLWERRSWYNRARLTFENSTMAKKLLKYFGDMVDYCDLNIKNKSTKYTKYEWAGGILRGYKKDGTTSCLKLHTFLKNRDLPEEIIQECMKIFKDKLEYEWHYDTLSNGYKNTKIGSCMRGNGDYYYNFDDHGKLLQAYLNGEEVGRAIVWSKVEGLPEGCLGFMDRIYPSDNHVVVDAFKNYGRKHHLMYKQQQSYRCDKKFIWCDAEIETKDLEMRIGGLEDYYTPFMDTFRYYSAGVLYNDSYRADYTLNYTNGEAMMESRSSCACCGASGLSEDDLIYSEHLDEMMCEECYYELHYTCECCGNTYHMDRMNRTADDYVCERCADINYTYCESEGYHAPDDDVLFCEDTQDYIPSGCDHSYSDHSSEYSYTQTTVEVTDHRGSSEQWFEDEAEAEAYQHSDGEYYTYEEETNEND